MMLEVVASLAIVAIIALCAASLAVGMGILQPANIPGPLMKILDEMTDRPLLKKLIAERVPVGQTIKIDPHVLREYLNRRVYAQEQVVNTIVEQIVLRFGKIKRTKPIGTFLISGPAGTGKTRMGKAIGEAIYGDEGYYLIEMNKLRSSEAMSVLFGAAPGLIGSDRQAGLIKHLIDHPQTVVILDEFEKASLEVQEAFLSAWTEGVIHDLSTGTKISTKDAIFVLTANAKQDEIAALAERGGLDADDLSDRCKKLLREVFPGHILSRIDYVFAFQPLDEEAVAALAADMIAAEADSRGFKCEFVSPEILMSYIESFYGPNFDGRDLDRRIEKDFGDAFAKLRVKYPSLKQVDISYDKKTREMSFKPAKAA